MADLHEAFDVRAELARLLDWLRNAAWPLWLARGIEPGRGFCEHLTLDTQACHADFRRLRVLTRQIYVFAEAHRDGMEGAGEAVRFGIEILRRHAARPDGGYAWRFDLDYAVIDDRRDLYDHAFVLLALSAAHAVLPEAGLHDDARALLAYLNGAFRHAQGGFQDALPAVLPRRQNPHMHLFEAALAAFEAFDDPAFLALGDELAMLFADRLFDEASGALPEYFDDALVAVREHGRFLVEPGHHCEWAWLLHRHRALGGAGDGARLLHCQYRLLDFVDLHAVVAQTGGICDEVWSDGERKSGAQRLWPQTERLKSEMLRPDGDPVRQARAAGALFACLRPDGLWSERRGPEGAFSTEAAPASSLYHLTCAILTAADSAGLRPPKAAAQPGARAKVARSA